MLHHQTMNKWTGDHWPITLNGHDEQGQSIASKDKDSHQAQAYLSVLRTMFPSGPTLSCGTGMESLWLDASSSAVVTEAVSTVSMELLLPDGWASFLPSFLLSTTTRVTQEAEVRVARTLQWLGIKNKLLTFFLSTMNVSNVWSMLSILQHTPDMPASITETK